MDQKSCPDKPS